MLNTKQTYLFIKVITLALLIYVVYTQSIVSELHFFTGLAFCSNSIAPIKPTRLSNEQKAQFNFTKELKEIIIGLILGDLNVQKDKRAINGNACLRFLQSTIHTDTCRPRSLHLTMERPGPAGAPSRLGPNKA
jgi:hypothetical protein